MATSLLLRRDAAKDDILVFASSTIFLFFWRAEALMVISYSGLDASVMKMSLLLTRLPNRNVTTDKVSPVLN